MACKQPAKGTKIAISAGGVEETELQRLGLSQIHLDILLTELVRHSLAQGANLLYGGHLGPQGFTKKMLDFVHTYNRMGVTRQKQYLCRIVNYLAWPYCKELDIEKEARFVDEAHFVKIGCSEEEDFKDYDKYSKRALTLTRMREQITEDMDIKVVFGGKTDNFAGFIPGIIEEVYLAMKAGKPVLLLAGFGGAATLVKGLLTGTETNFNYNYDLMQKADQPDYYEEVIKFFKGKKINNLNKLLCEWENERLLDTRDPIEAVRLVVKALGKFEAWGNMIAE